MAGFEQDAFNALRDLLAQTSKEAIPAAEDAASVVFRNAARSAAPVKSGQLRSSIKVIEGKDKDGVSFEIGASRRRRLFVGPEKKKGYYGFFVEKGHKSPKGKAETFYQKHGALGRASRDQGQPGWAFKSRRLAREAGRATHSQQGLTQSTKIDAQPWFQDAVTAAEPRALQAAENAFNAKLNELNGRK